MNQFDGPMSTTFPMTRCRPGVGMYRPPRGMTFTKFDFDALDAQLRGVDLAVLHIGAAPRPSVLPQSSRSPGRTTSRSHCSHLHLSISHFTELVLKSLHLMT